MPIYHIYNTNHLVVCGQQAIVYHKFIINDIEEKYSFIITTLNFLAMMYHNRRKCYCGYCLSSQAETKHVSGNRSVRILRRKREGDPNLVVSLEKIRTVTLLWQRLALSNGAIRAISSSALSIWIYCQKSIVHYRRRMLFI